MSAMDGISAFADKIWNGVDEGYEWIRGVIFGEWQDNRSTSQVVTDALVGFVPGLGSIVTLRDLIAVIFRLAKHPEKREDVSEWILLIAMLLPLIITVLGLAAAGIGALVGEEVGGFFRAVALFLVKEGGVALKTLLDFLHAHGYGAASEALRKVKFAAYQSQVAKELANQIAKLKRLLAQLGDKVASLHPEHWPSWMPGQSALLAAPGKIKAWTEALTALGQKAHDMIPKALIEMDKRLGALLAGNVKGAVQTTHAVATGVAAPKVERAVQDAEKGVARNAHDPEPGNTRRVPEKQVVRVSAVKTKAEYAMTDSKGLPVGAKPYVEGETAMENPALESEDWGKYKGMTKQGYPDLAKDPIFNRPATTYDTFSGDLQPLDIQPGEQAERVIPHDGPGYVDTGGFWTDGLPADGEQLRAGTAVKESWNKNGSYVTVTAPPAGDPVWQEIHQARAETLGVDPSELPYDESIKGWKGTAASQRYEYTDPETGKTVGDNYYLPGGDEQYYLNPKEMAVLKQHGYVSERKPTNFSDYDKDIVNPDGTKGNIVPKGGPTFVQIPTTHAVPFASQADTNAGKAP